MKSKDRNILIGLAVAGLLVAFWVVMLSPKRAELSELATEVSELEVSVADAEQRAVLAEQAKTTYSENYHRLVVLGKAVPENDDAASLLVQTAALAEQAGIHFKKLDLVEGGGELPAPVAAETTADPPAEGGVAPPAATPTTAPATEASAATLPIGATVGSAGLPVMPYDLSFEGDFFDIADFMARLDAQVQVPGKGPVNGRLITVDGFALTGDDNKGFPYLDASLHVTTFVTPPDQGLTAGATEVAPPAAISTEPVPVSTP